MAVHNVSWNDERVELLKSLRAQNWSASKIARELGNVTRSAVLGKIQRLGLSGPPNVKKIRLPKRRILVRRQGFNSPAPLELLKPSTFKARTVPVASLNLTLFDLEQGQCRFATTDDKPFLFCGNPRQDDSSYCAAHHQLTHQVAHNISDEDRQRRSAQWRKMHRFKSAEVAA